MKEEVKSWIRPLVCGFVVAIVMWGLRNLWEGGKMKPFITDFVITFSPVFLGIIGFLIYWLARDYRKLRKFSYRHDHAIQNIQGLKEKIDITEKEPLRRIAMDDTLKGNINKLENAVSSLKDVVINEIAPLLPGNPLPGGPGHESITEKRICEKLKKA